MERLSKLTDLVFKLAIIIALIFAIKYFAFNSKTEIGRFQTISQTKASNQTNINILDTKTGNVYIVWYKGNSFALGMRDSVIMQIDDNNGFYYNFPKK